MENEIEKKVELIVSEIIESRGYILVDIEFRKGKYSFLKIYIDRKEGNITISEIEKISKEISLILDTEDPIENPYILEVSSPGLDRNLVKDREIKWALNKKVKAFLKDGKVIEGTLQNYDGNFFSISGNEIKKSEVAKLKLNEV
jgi:ribosome maturation factor RimP